MSGTPVLLPGLTVKDAAPGSGPVPPRFAETRAAPPKAGDTKHGHDRSDKLSTRIYHSTGAVSFSTKGEYGVRLMAQLARRFRTGPRSLAELTEREAHR